VRAEQEEAVNETQQHNERRDSGVEDARDDGRALHVVHTQVQQPVEDLEEEQQREQRDELGAEVIPEHCEGQARFRHGVEKPLHQMLIF